MVTAFPSASDSLWTHGFDQTGHLVFPTFNAPDRERNAKAAILNDSALRSEVSLGPNEHFCLQAALVLN